MIKINESTSITDWFYEMLQIHYDMVGLSRPIRIYVSKHFYSILVRTIIYQTFKNVDIFLVVDEDRYEFDYGFTYKKDLESAKNINTFLDE